MQEDRPDLGEQVSSTSALVPDASSGKVGSRPPSWGPDTQGACETAGDGISQGAQGAQPGGTRSQPPWEQDPPRGLPPEGWEGVLEVGLEGLGCEGARPFSSLSLREAGASWGSGSEPPVRGAWDQGQSLQAVRGLGSRLR